MSIKSPTNKKELFARLREILQHGWYDVPKTARTAGTGGPGNFLEDLFGLTTGNLDIADSLGWELKYYTDKTNLITLFHKEPQPKDIMLYMVRKYGWLDSEGRKGLRHTISRTSDMFTIEDDAGRIIIRPKSKDGNDPVAYWAHDTLLTIAGGKLRRLLLVKGEKKDDKIRFVQADCFENLHLGLFAHELEMGTVLIDLDAREARPESSTLRNHGTKFRVPPENMCRLYMKKERFVI